MDNFSSQNNTHEYNSSPSDIGAFVQLVLIISENFVDVVIWALLSKGFFDPMAIIKQIGNCDA